MQAKIFFPIAILILLTNLLNAQVEFPTLNAHWCYEGYTELSFDPWNYCISPSELIELNGKSYSKISYNPDPRNWDEKEILYREEDRKFYVIPQDSTDEILIYDFNLEVGDTFAATWGWPLWDSTFLRVHTVDTITTVDGVERKKISLRDISIEWIEGSWIEGIGSEQWIFVYPGYSDWIDAGYYVSCHFQEEEPIYSPWGNAEFCDLDALTSTSEIEINSNFDLYPNPVQDQMTVQFLEAKTRFWELINVHGKIAQNGKFAATTETLKLAQLPIGIYFLRVEGFKMERVVVGIVGL